MGNRKSCKAMKKKQHELQPRLKNELAATTPIQQYARVLHAVNPGDLIAAMGALKKYYDITQRKLIVAQSVSTVASYYPGAIHPTVNERGENVCCNIPMWEKLKPLIESQEYIHSFEQYQGQKIDLDFNVIRGKTFVNLPHGAIQGWLPLAFPDLSFDISKSWITLDDKCPTHIKKQVSGKVVLNFTERYRNALADYFFLQNYAPDLIFAGTEQEHFIFCNKWGLTIPYLKVDNFLELAYAIKECRFILANQSFNYNIAEAIKKPRILEICQFAQNCIHGIGEDSYGFLHQVGVEYFFKVLYNKTMRK